MPQPLDMPVRTVQPLPVPFLQLLTTVLELIVGLSIVLESRARCSTDSDGRLLTPHVSHYHVRASVRCTSGVWSA